MLTRPTQRIISHVTHLVSDCVRGHEGKQKAHRVAKGAVGSIPESVGVVDAVVHSQNELVILDDSYVEPL